MHKLDKLNKQLEQDRVKLQKREALARALKIKKRQQNFMKIGELLEKASIDSIDQETLFGAFLEISQKSKDEKLKTHWKSLGEKALKDNSLSSKTTGTPLEISFKAPPPSSLKSALKERKFKWNSIRGIWEGRGAIDEVQAIVASEQGTVKKI